MIARLWFVLSLSWVALLAWSMIFWNPTHDNYRIEGCPIDSVGFWLWVFWPFLLGWIVRRVFRYVVTGSWRRPATMRPRPVRWRQAR